MKGWLSSIPMGEFWEQGRQELERSLPDHQQQRKHRQTRKAFLSEKGKGSRFRDSLCVRSFHYTQIPDRPCTALCLKTRQTQIQYKLVILLCKIRSVSTTKFDDRSAQSNDPPPLLQIRKVVGWIQAGVSVRAPFGVTAAERKASPSRSLIRPGVKLAGK